MNLSESDRKSVPKAFACGKTAVLSQAGFACPQQRKLPAVFEVLHCELMAEKPEIHVVNIGSDAAIVDLIQAETKRGAGIQNCRIPAWQIRDIDEEGLCRISEVKYGIYFIYVFF